MIQIKNNKLDNTIDKHYTKILNYINQDDTHFNIDDINCDLVCLYDKDLEQIIKLKQSEMILLIKKDIEIYPSLATQLNKLYEVFRNKWATSFVQELDITVCPYCNREYIFKFEDTKKNKPRVISTFDHYYSKSTYPFLSISFFNLIPCCHICNSKFKHKENFYEKVHLHPYEDDFNTLVKFKLNITNSNFCHSVSGFDIELSTTNKKQQIT